MAAGMWQYINFPTCGSNTPDVFLSNSADCVLHVEEDERYRAFSDQRACMITLNNQINPPLAGFPEKSSILPRRLPQTERIDRFAAFQGPLLE